MTHEQLMRLALTEAAKAAAIGEVPIGCVIWHEPSQAVIGVAHNVRERDEDPTAHAEVVAIQQAARYLKSWRLTDCTLAVTLEPCPMCAGAIVNAQIPRLLYGCNNVKAGAVRTLYRLCDDPRLNHRAEIVEGVLADECAEMLKAFFREQRALGKNG